MKRSIFWFLDHVLLPLSAIFWLSMLFWIFFLAWVGAAYVVATLVKG